MRTNALSAAVAGMTPLHVMCASLGQASYFQKGVSRDWGDHTESDTICRARRQRGDCGCGGFWGWLEPGSMVRWSVSNHGVQPTRLS